jgi:hypothetical protein
LSDIIKAPGCLSEDGRHVMVEAEPPFAFQCTECFERFVLLSETVAKEMNIAVKEREIDLEK